MRKIKFVLFGIAGMMLLGCGEVAEVSETAAEKNVTAVNEVAKTPSHVADKVEKKPPPAVELSEKQKQTIAALKNKKPELKVDEVTKNGIRNMSKVLRNLLRTKEATVDMYKKAGEALDKELKNIFEKSTVKGDSRKKMDKMLAPLSGLIKDLKEKDKKGCVTAIRDLIIQIKLLSAAFK